MKSKQEILEDKINQFIVTCRHQEPDRVPIFLMISNLAIGYGGVTVRDCFKDRDLERECWAKVFRDVYTDAAYCIGMNWPFEAYIDYLKTDSYIISENNQTMQHVSSTYMKDDEYDEFINDTARYIANKVGYRKLKGLHKPYPENYKILKKSIEYSADFAKNVAANRKFAAEELALPLLTQGNISHPLDMFMDYVRGFENTMIDIRRRPEQVLDALEAFIPFYESSMPKPNSREEYPFILNTAHIPPFLSAKQFEKFYWPYYQKMVNSAKEAGTRLMTFCEGNWSQHYDFFNTLPKGSMIDIIEDDDIFEAKKKIGQNVVITGGMPTSMLRYSTRQECLDYAKHVIDECASGGGFIFALDKILIDSADVNMDNLAAVTQFVHENGVYKKEIS